MPALTKVPSLLVALLLLAQTPTTTTAAVSSDTTAAAAIDESSSDTTATSEKDWRDHTLIYQILTSSFQDSDGDGRGDLQGIIDRLDYLDEIGIDTIRLSSICSSSQIDSGNNVINYTDIDSAYGDFNVFHELIKEAHAKDLKVILDIIPNHSSDLHDWFISSANNTEPYDDYYIWADGRVLDNKVVPPNNWKNAYNDDDKGSAWTWHTERKQWYYHKYHPTEPDLNLRNEDVIQEILKIFDFWLEKGVDGFCLCGVSYLFEDEKLSDESSDEDNDDNDDDNYNHHTQGLPENAELLYRFRKHIDEWVEDNHNEPKLLIGEVAEYDDNISSYYGNETNNGIIPLNINFVRKLNDTFDAKNMKDLIEKWINKIPEGAEPNWMLSNQDHSRAASRLNPDLLDGLNIITLLLPGQAVTYYGEEIGMLNTKIPWIEKTIDNYFEKFRTPMQWDNTISAGFSTNKTTFLPVNPNYININVKSQLEDKDSDLKAYKTLANLRKNSIFTDGNYEINTTNDDNIFILKRSLGNDTCLAIINFGSCKQTVNLTVLYPNLEEDLQVMVDSSNANVEKENDGDNDGDVENDSFVINANAAAVLCDKDDFEISEPETTTNNNLSTDDDTTTSKNDDTDDEHDDQTKSNDLTSSLITKDSKSEVEAQNSANKKQAISFIILFHLTLVLLLREL